MIREKIMASMTALDGIAVIETDYKARGYHLEVTVAPSQVVAVAESLDRQGFFLEAVTGVDLLLFEPPAKPEPKENVEASTAPAEVEEHGPQMEVVYDYNHTAELCRVVVRTRVARENPEVDTISGVFAGANWHERETHDFFGIKFIGHPDLSPLLLPEDADFHPLRKDFTP